jgi:hypothetical protein
MARSMIANAQRCINLFPEANPPDAAAPVTHYPTPGLTLVSTPPISAPCRGIYTATNGNRYDVVGQNVYAVSGGVYTLLGSLTTGSGPVSMVDNGFYAVIVDGTSVGYSINLTSNVMAQITDPAFYGGSKVDFVDGYFIFNRPGTQQFYISNALSLSFNSLNIASKSTYPDNLVTLAVMHRELWLIGELTTEVWYNTGASDFTFGRMPGVFIEHGCAAKYSVVKIGLALFWLSKDLQGQCIVMKGENYQGDRVSNHALEQEISGYSSISDAVGYSYMQAGHQFYMLTFPIANKTWCLDLSTGMWHQRAYMEVDGSLSRHRSNCHSFNNGQNLVGDWQTGAVYALDPKNYTDNGAAILRVRSFPHFMQDAKRVFYRQFIADMEVGNGLPLDSDEPEIRLRWSDDRGESWSNYVAASLGKVGKFLTSIQWQRLGYARDRVFELSWSVPVKTALNGAFVDINTGRT